MENACTSYIDHEYLSYLSSEEPDFFLVQWLKIFNVIAEGVIVTDADDKILLINKSHPLLTYLEPEDIIGKSAFDLTRREKYWTIISDFDVYELKNDLKARDFRMRSKWGHELILTATPVLNDIGKLTWIVFTTRDIDSIMGLDNSLKKEIKISQDGEHTIKESSENLICSSPAMKEIVAIVEKVCMTNSYVFLMGESGVGKDRIARQIHLNGPWAAKPFIHVNCASIPESLFESELFGYEKGSFTGARSDGKTGLFEMAADGTLYLDEITEMSFNLQAKLLQVLQERNFRRVGGGQTVEFKARVISSTNRNIDEIMGGKGFRQDLFYRLCVIPIHVPPLREREEDIPALTALFLEEYNSKHGQNKKLRPDLVNTLQKQSWPGNVRELQHTIERLVIMTSSVNIGTSDYLAMERRMPSHYATKPEDMLKSSIENIEKDMIRRAALNSKNTREAAKSIGISQATFLRKAKKYQIY